MIDNLRSGHTRSCGCLLKIQGSINGKATRKHGHYRNGRPSRTYTSWQAMKDRCFNTNHVNYHLYGGRGITVCKRWVKSFKNFLKDMGKRPPLKTLDRKNTNRNYTPSNCRWATLRVQAINRRQRG